MNDNRIFIVEDEAIVAEDLTTMLTRLGYKVAGVALSGKEALRQVPLAKPDLVLMDIQLGGDLDGIDTAVFLRQRHGLPTIFLTAYGDDHTLGRAKAAEPFGYITKPFDETRLRPVLAMALERVRLEKRLDHLLGIMRAVRGVNQLISREKEAEVLAEKVCRILVSHRGYHNAWITLLDEEAQPICLIAASRRSDTLFVNKISQPGLMPPCGRQALEVEGLVTQEEEEVEDCQDCPLPERYQEGALIGPLHHEGRVYGVLGVSVPAAYVHDPEEVSLFGELREDLGNALHTLALEAEHRKALEALVESEARYRNVVEHVGVGISLINPDMKILSLNRQMREWFPDLDPDQKPQCYEAFNNPPRSAPCSYCPVVKTFADGLVHEAVTETPRGDRVRNYRIIATPVKDAEGRITGVIEMVDDITAREEAVRKIKKSEEQYRLLVQTIPLVVYSGSADGSVQFFYDKAAALTGYPLELFNSRKIKWLDLMHPEDLEGAKDVFRRALKGDKSYIREYRIFKKDGAVAWIREWGRIICDAQGKIEVVIGVLSNITERRQTQETLRQSEERYRILVENIKLGISLQDTNHRIIMANPAMARLFHKEPHELAGKECFREYEKRSAVCPHCPGKKAMATGLPARVETEGVRNDGSRFTAHLHAFPLFAPDGRPTGFIEMVEDISDRKQAEEALRRAKREMEQLIASLSSLLIGLSSGGEIMEWNPVATNTLGLEAKEVLGRKFSEISFPWLQDKVQEAIQVCTQTKESLRLEDLPFTRPDGKNGFLGLTVSPIRTETGEVRGIIIMGADITERRILESQLAQAQKLESIGQLAAGIAHEINTPIQFVSDNIRFLKEAFQELLHLLDKMRACLDVLAAGAEPDTIVAELKGAAAAADLDYLSGEIPAAIAQSLEGLDRVVKIVRAMKDFSHPGTQEKVALDLNKALENTITVSRNEWKYVAEVITDFDPDLPPLYCFPQELNQVFLNIIVNAAQAIKEMVGGSPAEKKTISVSTRREGDWVEVRLSDTGPGIPENIRHRIFDPFFTTKEVGKGTGQGLAISHAVIQEKHQGTITFESEEGVGTTFIIRLPLGPSMRTADGNHKAENSLCG
ncbi:MAG: PAS domain S-box protein [Desulfobaccales bacterium]